MNERTISHNTLYLSQNEAKTGSKVTRWCISLKRCVCIWLLSGYQAALLGLRILGSW